MANYDEIKSFVEAHYDLAVESITPITQKSMKVRANNHNYLLKVASGDDDFIMKQLFAYKVLSHNVLPIYRTKANEHCVLWRDHFFYLSDYVQTIPLPLEQQIHYYIELLEKLHKETRLEVDVSDDELQRIYDKDYKRLQDSYNCLQKNIEKYELQRDRSPYEWYFMMIYPMLYTMLHHAHDELKKFYDLIKKEKKLQKHGWLKILAKNTRMCIPALFAIWKWNGLTRVQRLEYTNTMAMKVYVAMTLEIIL